MMLGQICLNLSMVLYMIVYLPQLVHNRQPQHLHHLSIPMHFLLFLGYAFDLFYAVATHLPWQYLTVSTVGLILLSIQHAQITRHLKKPNKRTTSLYRYLLLMSFVTFSVILLKQAHISPLYSTMLGWISRLLFIFCFIPQLLKNHITQTNDALNRYYLGLSMTVTCLDLISAWCLHWGWPNKIGPVISLSLLMLLFFRHQNFLHRPVFNYINAREYEKI